MKTSAVKSNWQLKLLGSLCLGLVAFTTIQNAQAEIVYYGRAPLGYTYRTGLGYYDPAVRVITTPVVAPVVADTRVLVVRERRHHRVIYRTPASGILYYPENRYW